MNVLRDTIGKDMSGSLLIKGTHTVYKKLRQDQEPKSDNP